MACFLSMYHISFRDITRNGWCGFHFKTRSRLSGIWKVFKKLFFDTLFLLCQGCMQYRTAVSHLKCSDCTVFSPQGASIGLTSGFLWTVDCAWQSYFLVFRFGWDRCYFLRSSIILDHIQSGSVN
jgi:hypothetical protein